VGHFIAYKLLPIKEVQITELKLEFWHCRIESSDYVNKFEGVEV
jgi:hypothetical protein